MKRKSHTYIIFAAALLLLFLLFTLLVAFCDVRPVGAAQSEVGLASVNGAVLAAVGAHPVWYAVTEWLGIAAILTAGCFGLEGLRQLIRRKRIGYVDRRLLLLAAFYAMMAACWLLFDALAINCRPVLMDGVAEPSYPSSHVLLAVCVFESAAMQLRVKYPERRNLCAAADAAAAMLSALAAVGRLLSGVHWFTDVVGSLLLSGALLASLRGALEFSLPFSSSCDIMKQKQVEERESDGTKRDSADH